jgi:hypothetical protein
MTEQKISQNDVHGYNAPDQPAPFTNGVDSSRRIPEGFVNSAAEKEKGTGEWRLGYNNIQMSGGFMEEKGHGRKGVATSYIDSENPDPNNSKSRPAGTTYNIGIDYVVQGDKKVNPWYGGTVEQAKNTGKGYGNQVIVKTNQNYEYGGKKYPIYTAYSHLASISVKRGQQVYPNSSLGIMGGTGRTPLYPEHVDFQSYIKVNGKQIQVSPNLMQDNLKQQQKEGRFNYNTSSEGSSTSTIASGSEVTEATTSNTNKSATNQAPTTISSNEAGKTTEKQPVAATSSERLTALVGQLKNGKPIQSNNSGEVDRLVSRLKNSPGLGTSTTDKSSNTPQTTVDKQQKVERKGISRPR